MPSNIEYEIVSDGFTYLKFTPDNFFKCADMILEYIYDPSADRRATPTPTLFFENDYYMADEIWKIKDGRFFSSSYGSGSVFWSEEENQYVGGYNRDEKKYGQLKWIEIIAYDWLIEKLEEMQSET